MLKPTDRAPDFVDRRKLNWGDTDSARMAYTGRFLDFVVEAVEHWFDEFFGLDWYDLNEVMGFGTPFRHVELEFRDKLTPRDIVETELRISRVTRTTISFEILSYGNSRALGRRLCFTGKCTIVFVKFNAEKSTAIPDEFREKLKAAGFTD